MKKASRSTSLNALETEIAVTALRSSGNFQLLRKINLQDDSRLSGKTLSEPRIGLCIDTETTGLDHAGDKVIETGIVAFEYDPVSAEITRVVGRYSGFEDPGRPISAEITEITGITDDMVRGHSFDDEQVNRLAGPASLVIAHNAGFDRPFVEARFPAFAALPWACTVSQINWQGERIGTRVLEYLLFKFGWFINAHRALDDAEGVLGILLENLPVSKTPVFKALLESCGEETAKIYAVGAPFDAKEILKQRGYRWNDGSQGGGKAWWTSVPVSREAEELAWLSRDVYSGGSTDRVEISRVNARDRFSVRER